MSGPVKLVGRALFACPQKPTRDQIAVAVLGAVLSNPSAVTGDAHPEAVAAFSYFMADTMLRASTMSDGQLQKALVKKS